jgi:hypothetical protein
MRKPNKHGLSGRIPPPIELEIRRRSKFGCVNCRLGIYTYEHIDPPFREARAHDADSMCCLCWTCQDLVTRRQLSKKKIKTCYDNIQAKREDEVPAPWGPIDFHDGTAELLIGGLLYSPAVQTILRYHGQDLIKVVPGTNGNPGTISATFTDEEGREVLRLEENVWVGARGNWDVTVVGQRITVRRKRRAISLQLRLDPPGRIVIERLDMRVGSGVGSGHVIATEQTWAVGRYGDNDIVHWVRAPHIRIHGGTSVSAAIEFIDPATLAARNQQVQGNGLSTPGGEIKIRSDGLIFAKLGIVIASGCQGYSTTGFGTYVGRLSGIRRELAMSKKKKQ